MESVQVADQRGSAVGPVVLIVERDSAYAEMLEAAFRQAGFGVRQEPDGAAALALIDEAPPSLLLLDLDTPVIPGIRVLGLLRERIAGRVVPVLAIAPLCAEDGEEAMAAGADAVCCKLAPVDEIVTTAFEVLRHARSHGCAATAQACAHG